MHPLLEHLSIFTWMNILETNEKSIALLEDLKLIPKRTDPAPACPKCSGPMDVEEAWLKKNILGWKWRCKKRYGGQTPQFEAGYLVESQYCFAGVNPLDGTFFEDIRLPLNDILALIFGYILQISFTNIKEHLNCWRICRNESQVSDPTIQNIYFRLDQVILFALSQHGKSLKKHEKVNRKILLKEYAKTLKVEPVFRNIVFQLLMAIKHRYPCIKNEIVCENVDSALSTNTIYATNENILVNSKASNEIILDSFVSTASSVLKSCVFSTDNLFVKSVTTYDVPITESVENTNLKALNSTDIKIDNAVVRSVNVNSVPVTPSDQTTNLETLSSSVFSVDNTIVKKLPIVTSAQTTYSEALNSAVSVDNTVESSLNANNVLIETGAQIANLITLNSSAVNVDNSIVKSETVDSVPIVTSVHTTNPESLNSVVSVDNTIESSLNANNEFITAGAQIANSITLNPSAVNVDSSIAKCETVASEHILLNGKIADLSNYQSISTENSIVKCETVDNVHISLNDKIADLSNYQSISTETVILNENSIKTEHITNSNTSFSSGVSFANSNFSSKDNFISNSCSDSVIIDGIVHDDMDIGSVVDVLDSAQITNIVTCKNLNLSNCPNTIVADAVIYNQNENNTEMENVNNMNTSISSDISFEANTALSDYSVCNSSSDRISVDGSLNDNSMYDSSSDHEINDGSLSDNSMCDSSSDHAINDGSLSNICNSPSDHVIIDGSLADNSFCTASSDCVIIDGIVFDDDLAMNVDHFEIVNTTNNE